MEGSLIIKGNYYYAKFRVNGKQKMIATKIPVKGNNKRRAEQKMKEITPSTSATWMPSLSISMVKSSFRWSLSSSRNRANASLVAGSGE